MKNGETVFGRISYPYTLHRTLVETRNVHVSSFAFTRR